ncbi:hypothetical protein [Leifsonia virtsii]|uniref:Uncharacterized protein n=1 Tax=Leifsonia virtsii TaxID=3035915 RepID=A0ABT8IU65_9MICO|nr:hypothetical protein [Leifsonia virtsii]MDN4596335.1 hypothetical protein [Leifsonia virtsii]
MTSWPEEPPTGQPQTRRQAREFARRAGTAEPTPAGQVPDMTTSAPPRPADDSDTAQPSDAPRPEKQGQESAEAPAIPASAFAEPGVSSPSRDGFDLFRQAPDSSRPEPVTQPMAILQTPESATPAQQTPAQPKAASADSSPAASAAFPERTLTRRELRAMQQAQQANAQANHPATSEEQVFPVAFTSGPESGSSASAGDAAKGDAVPQSAETSTSEKTAWPFAPLTPSSAPSAARAGAEEPTVTQTTASPFAAFGATATPKPSTPAEPESPAAAAAPTAAAPAASATSEDTAAQERRPFTPPTGHWSTAAELDDQNQPITSRNVAQSTAATTTNALILPAIPQPSAAPLTSTGEILVTGSIDLPRGMGATGAHPDRIDSSDIDRLLDGEENEFNTSEVQPVRASRAISTHTSTRGVIAPPKKRGNALPVVLMVTAGVLAVGVIGLLVAAYVLKVF